jgi:hypothetical protein
MGVEVMKYLKSYQLFEGSDDFRKEMDNLQQNYI